MSTGPMNSGKFLLALPSKGRLMEETTAVFAARGLTLRKIGHPRGYRGAFDELPNVDVAFISASEIADHLKSGAAHAGVTGEDLIREIMPAADAQVDFVAPLGFGHADVVVAVPSFWVDVHTMADLDQVSVLFRRTHGRWLKVATKYIHTTRRFFAEHGVTDYRIVESLGATEGTPSAGTADLIVDITSTGETLRANGLRILDDGVILRSQANLVISQQAVWTDSALQTAADLRQRFKVA